MQCISSAPGKLVLSGEYAVLCGAPAIVLAMNRRATAELQLSQHSTCTFDSTGFKANSNHDLSRLLSLPELPSHDPAYLAWHILQQLKQRECLKNDLSVFMVKTDSSALFFNDQKLGLGSSASICTSLCANFIQLLCEKSYKHKLQNIFDIACAAHKASQGGSGSGLDIASATYGGMLKFQMPDADPDSINIEAKTSTKQINPPENFHYQVIHTGQSSNTRRFLKNFAQWQSQSDTRSLDALCDAAVNFSTVMTKKPSNWHDAMHVYIDALQNFDKHAQQSIYTKNHSLLSALALEHGILYKPCGAGGGDLGIALADNPAAIASFTQAIPETRLKASEKTIIQPIDLEIDTNGVHTKIL